MISWLSAVISARKVRPWKELAPAVSHLENAYRARKDEDDEALPHSFLFRRRDCGLDVYLLDLISLIVPRLLWSENQLKIEFNRKHVCGVNGKIFDLKCKKFLHLAPRLATWCGHEWANAKTACAISQRRVRPCQAPTLWPRTGATSIVGAARWHSCTRQCLLAKGMWSCWYSVCVGPWEGSKPERFG